MFNPDQIGRLKAVLASDHQAQEFDGVQLGRVVVSLSSEENQIYETQSFFPPDNIFGSPVNSDCLNGVAASTLRAPMPELKRLENVRVVGHTALVSGGYLYFPDILSYANLPILTRELKANHHGMVARSDSSSAEIIFGCRRLSKRFAKTAVFLPNIEPGNFGSFIFRQLTQLVSLKRIDVEFDCYIASDRTPWIVEAIKLLGLPQRPVFSVREVSGDTFDAAYLFNNLDAEGLLHPSLNDDLSRFADLCRSISRQPSPSHLFVSRMLSSLNRPYYRPLANEAELIQAAGDTYYEIFPETLCLSDQIAIFRSARVIVGPSGSGMLNAAFALPGSRVLDLESFHVCVRQHAKIYSSSGKKYSFAFGLPDESDKRALEVRRWYMPMQIFLEGLSWVGSN